MGMIHGKGGSVTWTGTGVVGGEILSWSVDTVCDTADATNMASEDDWKEFLAGFKSWTATAEVNWESGDTTALSALGETGVLTLSLVAAGANVEGTAICTGVGFTEDKDDIVKVSYSFQGSGALTYGAS